MDQENSEKIERPHPWPDPPPQLPILEISCPSCHDPRHGVKIYVYKNEKILECDHCKKKFTLRGCKIKIDPVS